MLSPCFPFPFRVAVRCFGPDARACVCVWGGALSGQNHHRWGDRVDRGKCWLLGLSNYFTVSLILAYSCRRASLASQMSAPPIHVPTTRVGESVVVFCSSSCN